MQAVQRYKNDGAKRHKLFVADAFAHPAKGHIAMWEEMVLRYSKEGDTILDPMAGIGTSLVAALMGRNVIVNEMEQHFVDPMRRSWEKMRTMPMLGFEMGKVCILRGDARCLPLPSAQAKLPSAGNAEEFASYGQGAGLLGEVDSIITSPPYANRVDDHGVDQEGWDGFSERFGRYTRPPVADVVITSPPYEGSIQGEPGIDWTQVDGGKRDRTKEAAIETVKAIHSGYTRPTYAEATVGRPVDTIVTSPSYENAIHPTSISETDWTDPKRVGVSQNSQARLLDGYARNAENIGNQRGDAYWASMRQVYAECWRVLRPGGIMALVLKGFVRGGIYQDLPGQTEAMLLEAGWVKHDHWRRELWSLSFWRILQKRRDPAAWDERLMFEEVLAFRKSSHVPVQEREEL